jgi:hypothetical protein
MADKKKWAGSRCCMRDTLLSEQLDAGDALDLADELTLMK